MPVQFVKDASGRWVSKGEEADGTAYTPQAQPAAPQKPKPKQKSWWEQTVNNLQYEMKRVQQNPVQAAQTYVRNAANELNPATRLQRDLGQLKNNVVHEQRQLANPETRAARLQNYAGTAALNVVSQHHPQLVEINRMGVQGIATGTSNLLRNFGGPTPEIGQYEDTVYQFTGSKPPSQMTEEEKMVNDIKSSLVVNAALMSVGGGVLQQVAPKAMALLNPAQAPNFFNAAGRFLVAEAGSDALSTVFEDNTGGSVLSLVDGLFGTKLDPVKPGMSYPEATRAALVPNAVTSVGLAGLGSAIWRNFPATQQATAGRRIVDERSRQRAALENGGVVQSNPEQGASAFTPEVAQEQQAATAPAAAQAPAQASAPAAGSQDAASGGEAAAATQDPMAQLGLGPDVQDVNRVTGEVIEPTAAQATPAQATPQAPDPWQQQYDPELPEADVALDVIERLDDDELRIAAEADDPITTAAELLEQRPEFDPAEIEGLDPSLVRAPADALAEPQTPWRSQWQALPSSELQAMAASSPEFTERLLALTGKAPGDAVKTDLIDALDSLAADGNVYLPSRMQPGGTIVSTAEIQVDPARFQFKQGVDAQGQQKGNSLSGVDRWNTDVEGAIQIWSDPADGRPYVVNGHNRVAKAKELGIPSLRADELLAGTDAEARAAGALANIASGGGTAFDAAKFFRDSGVTDPAALQGMGIPLASGNGTQGIALAQLPSNIFQDAIDGRISLNKAVALGGSGLDEAAMQAAYKVLQGRDMADLTWLEVLQQAKSAPVIEGQQVDLFGNSESISLMVQKGDLARRIEADITGDKNLFGRTARNAGTLEGAGNRIDRAASGDVAAKAAALLDAFSREKYLAGSRFSELLNEGAQQIANGAKPSVVAKRIKQELVQAMDQVEVPAVKPEAADSGFDPTRYEQMSPEQLAKEKAAADKALLGKRALANRQKQKAEIDANQALVQQYLDDMPGSNSGKELTEEAFLAKYGADETKHPQLIADKTFTKVTRDLEGHDWAVAFNEWYAGRDLTADERTALQMTAVRRAAANGRVRPPATPIPEVPTTTANVEVAMRDLQAGELTDEAIRLLDDEARLQAHYQELDARIEAEQLAETRDAVGYDELSFEQKKALGITEGYEIPEGGLTSQNAGTLDERAAFARQQLEQAQAQGDEAGANAWRQELRQLERSRLANAQAAGGQNQGGLFPVGLYDDGAPLLNQPPAAPAIEIPAGASRKITARTGEARIESAAQSLQNWARSVTGEPMSMDEALALVRGKGSILDPDKIPGLDMDAARADMQKGVADTPATQAVADAYRQFYGVDPAPGRMAELGSGPYAGGPDGYLELSPDQLSPLERVRFDQLDVITRDLTTEIQRIAGADVQVKVDPRQYIAPVPRAWGGSGRKALINGEYDTVSDLVLINGAVFRQDSELLKTAFHEAFHRIQFSLLTKQEMKVMDSLNSSLRTLVRNQAAGVNKNVAAIEHQAVAFAEYAAARQAGQDPLLRLLGYYDKATKPVQQAIAQAISVFDKIWNVIERTNNWARGRGYQSVTDLFEQVYLGKIGQREPDFALEYLTQDQIYRADRLAYWQGLQYEVSNNIQNLDARINQLRTKLAKEGC